MKKKVILITGASSGLGKATAIYLSSQGHTVIGTSRNGKSISSIKTTDSSSNLILLKMDIRKEESIEKIISFIKKKYDTLDVLINNAGIGISASIEESSITDSKELFDTNFFGNLIVTQHVLPIMRKQGFGLIITLSSIGGVLGLPFQGMYSASKFAVEGAMESLRMEVNKFGINVVIVEPGDFKTSFTKNRKKYLHKSSPYYDLEKKTTEVFEHDEINGSDPNKVANLIGKIIDSRNPKVRYRVGSFSQKLAASFKGVLSDRLVQWILMKYYKVR